MDNIPTVSIPIDSVKPWPANPNTHTANQIEELAKSYGEWSQYKNIVVWRGFVICGNGFYLAAKSMGATEIEVKDFSHLSEAEAERLAVADNETPRGSELDYRRGAEIMERAKADGKHVAGVDDERAKEIMARAREESLDVDFPEYDESIADTVEYITCPECGHKWPK